MSIPNFTEYFKNERDVYVQNISNCQVSVSFEVGPGHSESYLFTNSKDPVNLTSRIPFSAVKNSMDLRKMLNRVPPALKLLDEGDYMKYYQKQAASTGLPSAEAALEKAEARRSSVQNHTPLSDAIEEEKAKDEDGKKVTQQPVAEVDEVNSRVLHLCLQVHPSVPDQSKMTAQQLLSELDGISGLNLSDWEYIQSHGFYKSVKNQAKKMVAQLAAEDLGAEDTPKKSSKKNKVTQATAE